MRALLSPPSEDGHLLLLRLPEDLRLVVQFADDGSIRDLTDMAATLGLTGALDAIEANSSGRPDPEEAVDVASLDLVPAELVSSMTATLMRAGTAEAVEIDPQRVLALLVRGLVVQVTVGVAAEAVAGDPDLADPDLTDPDLADPTTDGPSKDPKGPVRL